MENRPLHDLKDLLTTQHFMLIPNKRIYNPYTFNVSTMDIIQAMANGHLRPNDIAPQVYLTPDTVHDSFTALKQTLGVHPNHNNSSLLFYLLQKGVLLQLPIGADTDVTISGKLISYSDIPEYQLELNEDTLSRCYPNMLNVGSKYTVLQAVSSGNLTNEEIANASGYSSGTIKNTKQLLSQELSFPENSPFLPNLIYSMVTSGVYLQKTVNFIAGSNLAERVGFEPT